MKNDLKLGAFMRKKILNILGRYLIIAVVFLIFTITTPMFCTKNNLIQVMQAASIYVLMAMGTTHVIITGCTDLSAGSVVGLSGMICCCSIVYWDVPVAVAVALGLFVGVVCGLLNGILVTKMRIVPFIATLGTQWIFRGICNIMCDGVPVYVRSAQREGVAEQLYPLGGGRIWGIPISIIIFVILGIILAFELKKTVMGRNLYAVGSNKEAATLSGINADVTIMSAYMVCDIMAALAGILVCSRLVSAMPNAGQSYEFEGIFASVIGGASLRGGEGTIMGSIIGAFIVAILRNGFNLNGINSFWQQAILGVIIIIVVYIDALNTRRKEGQ